MLDPSFNEALRNQPKAHYFYDQPANCEGLSPACNQQVNFSGCGLTLTTLPLQLRIRIAVSEADMRLNSLLVLILFSLGCGAGQGNRNQGPHFSVALSRPSLTTLVPSSVPVNSAPFTMTVTGTNFGTDAIVFWNGAPQHTTFITSSQLQVAITDADIMLVGLIHVSVLTGGLNSNTVDFDVASQ
jgi:hypothetical protein